MKPGVIEVMIKGSKKHLKVTKIYIHESFKYETFSNDAALLKIEPHSQAATPICLPSAAISGTQTLSLVWWEGDSLDISQPGKFFKGETKAVHISDCKKKILQAAISYSFDNMQVCSGKIKVVVSDETFGVMWVWHPPITKVLFCRAILPFARYFRNDLSQYPLKIKAW